MTPGAASTVERAVENESVFRRVNNDIEASAEVRGAGNATFLCACADPTCHATIELALIEYAWIRRHPTYFVVAAGHEGGLEAESSARVVRWSLASSVVEKLGYAGALAAAAYRGSDDPDIFGPRDVG